MLLKTDYNTSRSNYPVSTNLYLLIDWEKETISFDVTQHTPVFYYKNSYSVLSEAIAAYNQGIANAVNGETWRRF